MQIYKKQEIPAHLQSYFCEHPDQIGREETPAEFVANLVSVFAEARRVLRKDGTLWVNLGDSADNDGKWGGRTSGKHCKYLHGDKAGVGREKRRTGLPPQSLCLIPERFVIAMQDAGWTVRSKIFWDKTNAMPSSAKDRPTDCYEMIYLFSQSAKYYYDADAIAQPCANMLRPQRIRAQELADAGGLTEEHIAALRAVGLSDGGKNAATQSGAGKNTPEVLALAEEARRVLGGYAREFLTRGSHKGSSFDKGKTAEMAAQSRPIGHGPRIEGETRNARNVWRIPVGNSGVKGHMAVMPLELARRCLKAGCPADGVALDPFFGAGTLGVAAQQLGRGCIGIELNSDYGELALRRLREDDSLFSHWEIVNNSEKPLEEERLM